MADPSTACAPTGMRPSAQSANPDTTVHGKKTHSPRNSAVKRSLGAQINLLRGADLGEWAVPHDRDLTGDRERFFLVVCHQQRRHTGRGQQLCDRLAGGGPQPGVERAERFIEQHQHRLAGQRSGQRHALLLPPG